MEFQCLAYAAGQGPIMGRGQGDVTGYCLMCEHYIRISYAQQVMRGRMRQMQREAGLCDGSRPVCVWGSCRDVQKLQAELREAGVTIRMHEAMPLASPRTWAKRQLHRTARVAQIKASFSYIFAYHAGVFGDVQVLLLGFQPSCRDAICNAFAG